jgi:hypothetical protein
VAGAVTVGGASRTMTGVMGPGGGSGDRRGGSKRQSGQSGVRLDVAVGRSG